MNRVSAFLMVLPLLLVGAAFADKPVERPLNFTRGALDCSNAGAIGCGDSVAGTTVGLANNVSGYSCISWNEGGPEKVYEIALPGPGCWIVTGTISGMAADLDIFFLGSCEEAECLAYGDRTFTTDCVEAGTYYVVVDGYGAAEDAFTLDVACQSCQCPGPIENETCALATEVFDGSVVTGTTAGALDDYDPDCAPYGAESGDVVYFIQLLPGQEIQVTLDAQYDAVLYSAPGCDLNLCCAADDVYPPPETDRIACCASEGGTYYIFVDGYGSASGVYTLTVEVGSCGVTAIERIGWSGVKFLYR